MSLSHDDVFRTPLPVILDRATALATAPTEDAFNDVWCRLMQEEMEDRAASLDMTPDALKALDRSPFLLRTWEWLEDLWWSLRPSPQLHALEDSFHPYLSPHLAATRPLQDVPGDYEEIEVVVDGVIAAIRKVIDGSDQWTPVAKSDGVPVWHGDGATLLLHVEGEDPKIMGYDLRLGWFPEVVSASRIEKMLEDDEAF
ncbi:MAG: hypothetical protein AAGA87_00100 [Pseudomonadota bacterium]